MARASKLRAGMIAPAFAGLITILLYAAFMATNFAAPAGGGEDRIANAFAAVAAWAALWLVLLTLLVIDVVLCERKSWREWLALLLVPIAGIAVLFATDYPSDKLCAATIAALPLVIGGYLLAGRGPAAWAGGARAVLLLLIAGLSYYPIARFAA